MNNIGKIGKKKPRTKKPIARQLRSTPDFFYDTKNSTLIVLMVILVVILSLTGLYMFKFFFPPAYFGHHSNVAIGIFIGVLTIFLGVMLAFVVTGESATFFDTQSTESLEATSIFLLYQTVSNMPNTAETQQLIIDYLNYIINVEFPLVESGIIPTEGFVILAKMSLLIYNYEPMTSRENALYAQSIAQFNNVISLNANRVNSASIGIPGELWWVLIFNTILVIVMTWFVDCGDTMHYLLTGIISAGLASMLFLIIALDFPYRGDFGLDSGPFQVALDNILKAVSLVQGS